MEHSNMALDPYNRAFDEAWDRKRHDGTHEITFDLAYKRLFIVNVMLYGLPEQNRGWVLIDAGIPGSSGAIINSAKRRFGTEGPPQCIILTHGHFDHIGSLESLANKWNVPVYAHSAEISHLDGTRSYPAPDPTVGGGIMSLLSPLFPNGPFNFSRWLRPLPDDGAVPGMPGWAWIHTPGHTDGHISLWREEDRVLIAGDAFITTRQESAYAVLTQKPELHGPPMYYTPDWVRARRSVELLASLNPEIIVTGHGQAMRGAEMRQTLDILARDFDSIAVPASGRYVNH